MHLSPGTQLDGYEILGLLGAGGMGEVYHARDPILKREVAIKILPAFVSQEPDRLRRFEQEAQAAAALNHPNILAIHRFGVFEGSPYLVAELLEGTTLRQLLERGPLPVRKAIDYGVQIAHGVAAAHEKGIVHRDLKPENLFVTKDGRIKILDFGLAKLTQPQRPESGAQPGSDAPTATHHATEPGLVMGTIGYMAPEQVRGQTVDHRTDIFALGAVLYEMLAGKRAFQRSTSADTMSAILSEDPPGISQIVQTTPLGLQRVVHRCLEKNPEQRFQSASDLAFALEASTESGTSSGAVTARTGHRWPRMALAWSAGLIVIVAVAAAAYFLIERKSGAVPLGVSDYTQITHDGYAGLVAGEDGDRLYLDRGIDHPIGQVSLSGGEIQAVTVPVPNANLSDVSPDGSTFLVASYKPGLLSKQPYYTVQILGGAQRYLVDASGAGWTPDGKSVVYFTPDGDSRIMSRDGTGDRKLASLGHTPDSFRWSPDGKTIRYSVDGHLWEMSASGTNPHELLVGWRSPHEKCCGAWSPDGDFYIFLSGPGPQIWVLDERHRIFQTQAPEPFQLTSGPIGWGSPVFSKDGKKIFASGSTYRGELVRYDAGSNQLQPFLGGISAEFLSFSKDGQSLAYISYPDGILWRANTDGSDPVQLSDAPMRPRLANFSPNGKEILFDDSSSRAGVAKAYLVSSQGGPARRLLPDDNGSETDPGWSPDGSKIAFSTSTEVGRDKNSTIRILDVATKQVTTVPGSLGMFSPRWSPDGQSIAANSFDGSHISIFHIKTQQWSSLYQGLLGWFLWSRDSKYLFLQKYVDDKGVYKIPVAGGKEERVVDLKNFLSTGYYGLWMGLDPTDAPLFLRDAGTTDIYALTLKPK